MDEGLLYNNGMSMRIQKLLRFSPYLVLTLICLASFGLMLWASLTDAGIMDELAHIPAGYGYVRFLDYRLNPEHPPLVKALAAFPLLFLEPNFPSQSNAWRTDVNGQWEVGTQFLYQSGNDANTIIRLARIMPMLLTILLIVLIYLWAKELLGNRWALFPAFIFGLSPTVLAHGHYVTTDIGAAFGTLIATWTFVDYLLRPSRRRLFFAGLAFGVAQIAKFSTALLVPYFIIILLTFYIAGVIRNWQETERGRRLRRFGIRALLYGRSLILIFIIGFLLVVYPIYFLFTANYPITRQTSDTEFILNSFAEGPQSFQECLHPSTPDTKTVLKIFKVPAHCNPVRAAANLNIALTKNFLTRPLAEYLLGVLMVFQRSAGGNTGYFWGQISAAGWHSYFPLVYLLKEPLPLLIMIFLALTVSLTGIIRTIIRRRTRFLDYLSTNFPEFSMMIFVIFYWAYSIKSPLNIGVRHLMPTLPFAYILTASALKRWTSEFRFSNVQSGLKMVWLWIKMIFGQTLKQALVLMLCVWFLAETFAAAPYFLSYFNEFGGGIAGGYRYVTDSNYDWGQDLLRLQAWVNAHPEVDRIGVDYFGAGNPKYYLGLKGKNWWSAHGNPADEGIHWLAVSVNTLQGAIEPLAPGQNRKPEDEYRWLTDLRPPAPGLGNVPPPDFRAGTSIFIYHL